MAREYAIRHIDNWIGEHGSLVNIHWSIMEPRSHWNGGKPVQVNPTSNRFLKLVPELARKSVNAHGLTGHVALVKSYI